MNFLKIVAFLIIAVGSIAAVATQSNKWATAMQQYYVRQSKKMYGENENWERPWIRTLFKALIFFFGFMFVLGVYVAIFSVTSVAGSQ